MVVLKATRLDRPRAGARAQAVWPGWLHGFPGRCGEAWAQEPQQEVKPRGCLESWHGVRVRNST